MRHTIIEILTTFTSSEIKGFRKFLHSPYFNTSKKLVELNDALTKFYPEFKNKNLSKERIYVKLHSKSRYNPFYMNVLLSKLEHLAEKFVKQRAYELSKEWDFVFVLDELCRRNSDKLYTRMLKRTEQKNPSYKDSDGDFFLREYFLERLKYNFSAAKGKIPGKKALYRIVDCLNNTNKYLLCYSVAELIKGYRSFISFHNSFKLDLNSNFMHEFLKSKNFSRTLDLILGSEDFREHRFIFEIYRALILMISSPKHLHYNNFKILLEKYSSCLNADDRSFFYGCLVDYCVHKKNAKFWNELAAVYDTMLVNSYYKNSVYKYIQVDLWRNILKLGIKTGKIEWLEDVIGKYRNALHPDNRRNVEYYSYAMLSFERKEFGHSLDYLSKLKYDYFVFKLDAENLKLKTFYELNYIESALMQIDAYKKALRAKYLADSGTRGHELFLKFVKKLIDVKDKQKKIDLYELEEKIASSGALEKRWLLDKVIELRSFTKAS